jgi:myo-inositol-1(or 4)-monophosphatase
MKEDLKENYLKLAIKACSLAGKKLLDAREQSIKAESETRRDIKLKGDRYSEDVILRQLFENSSYPVLSEEKGSIGDESADGLRWIVDPLDGSMNYSRAIPLNCVAIALWQNDQPILGVVNDFNRNEIFSGIVDQGAWLNGRRIRPSDIVTDDRAILCTGFPVNTDFSDDGIHKFVSDIKRYKKVRLLGSAALSLAYVACGRSDVYYEKDIMLWDVAAGIAIVAGAGGKADYKEGAKKYSLHVYASNGLLSQ